MFKTIKMLILTSVSKDFKVHAPKYAVEDECWWRERSQFLQVRNLLLSRARSGKVINDLYKRTGIM